MSEEVTGSSFLGSSGNYFLPESRSVAFSVDEDPWSSAGFEPVQDLRTSITQTIDDDIVTDGLTAANVLVGVDLPEIFDTAYIRAGPIGDRVSVEALEAVIALAGLGPRLFEQIATLIVPAGALYVTRNEFNTALALAACAQKNMDLSLMTVYHHRNDLPLPTLPNLDSMQIKRTTAPKAKEQPQQQQQSYDDDPWRPANTTATANIFPYQNTPKNDGTNNENNITNNNNNNSTAEPPQKETALTIQVEPEDENQWFTDIDHISVSIAEKEGFLFTHVNYMVTSSQRQSSVRRRYSDFYWFWEMLLKRYPFRLIPNLPPKKISGKDDAFLDRRCHGLSRFINCVVQHPVLKKDELVSIFLSEETEFTAWRRAQTPCIDEEFDRINPQTQDLESLIPKDIETRIDEIQKRLPHSIDKYSILINTMERNLKLKEARAAELKKYNQTLRELGKIEHKCFVNGCMACEQVVGGYESVGNYMDQSSTIIATEVASTSVLDSLKRHRGISISFLELLERRKKLAVHQIESTSKKIAANTAKVNQNRGVPGLESEVERLDDVIKSDSEQLQYQQRRDTYIRYCMSSETTYLHKQQAFVSLLYQNYIHEQLQYARRTVDNWKALEALLCNMPKPEDFV